MGKIMLLLDEYEEAEAAFLTAFKTRDQIYGRQNNLLVAEAAYWCGVTYFNMSEYQNAKDNFYKCLAMRQKCLSIKDDSID